MKKQIKEYHEKLDRMKILFTELVNAKEESAANYVVVQIEFKEKNNRDYFILTDKVNTIFSGSLNEVVNHIKKRKIENVYFREQIATPETKRTISPDNILANMLNLEKCKQLIRDTRLGEVAILIPHYSINVQMGLTEEQSEKLNWDFDELQDYLECSLEVSDYDDLVANPYSGE